jgi:dihydroorotase
VKRARSTGLRPSSLNGAHFYGLPVNKGTVEIRRKPATAPLAVRLDDDEVVVFRGGESLQWSIAEVKS